jgi:hypothetical protein
MDWLHSHPASFLFISELRTLRGKKGKEHINRERIVLYIIVLSNLKNHLE